MTRDLDELDQALIQAARQKIVDLPHVVGVIDGNVPGEFLVLTFQEAEDGDQGMTLETWTVAGPSGEKPGEFMVSFRPAHLEALAHLMTEGRKLLEREAKVAAPGTAN
ncbi:MAG: hypothetical protein KUA43_08825 [Hoeflea sp.]|uniref:hypothetical protein n=1 Tax=Hoeflea sp. TaxID=1940281 RepID=UPI001D7F8BAE|nr:hypothetical protein [Hoeflea sp.]MBU4529768.1 hypothetical protein [Alphaproteobacteria bacterium]MBU4543329.1 hypothetical protein [Alphaproteobacteria bacterium]MBU4552516.1 hypothetical protein [Alphaproteobacteria bacterium]MBV1723532.1 hypothetical protein [Hoeflea sp.]MBV1762981.1 hypothetical protein [Hoeflea sp.]